MGMESGILFGHVVSRKDLKVNTDKVRAILALLALTYVKEVPGFLSCIGYYKRFIKGYARCGNMEF